MLNTVWILFFLIAFIGAFFQLLQGDTDSFKRLIDSIFSSSKGAILDIAFPLAGAMTFFSGILLIGEKSGVIAFLSRLISPFFSKLFPEVPKNHPAMGQMVMNFSANLLGLDNAATPFGLKAMESLQEVNPTKANATNAQIMFLVLHTSGLTLIPIGVITQRAILGAANPSDILLPALIATYITTLSSILIVGVWQKINLFHRHILIPLTITSLFLLGILFYFSQLDKPTVEKISRIFGNFFLFSLIVTFLLIGWYKKIDLFSTFVEGAKVGFDTSLKIIPYLVGMLVAIGVFRTSGILEYGLLYLKSLFSTHYSFIDALPVALMRPISGSGSKALMIDLMKQMGADSFQGRLACLFQSAADTTFYIIALYFGSVGIKNVRYALTAGLVADGIGVISATFIAYLFF